MLSYRHAYHAGNYADVLKHIVLIEILAHLVKKDKPFDYIDTHAGAGLYHLGSEQSNKVGEYRDGIARIFEQSDEPLFESYINLVRSVNPETGMSYYPGSPEIASQFLRPQDRAWLFELHPADFATLSQHFTHQRQVKVAQQDGFQGLIGLLPPVSRRGLVVIDPSYELKEDYSNVVRVLLKAVKRFATGIYALWYPVVLRERIDALERELRESGIRDVQLFELGIAVDSSERGMTSSGMIVINPPWQLKSTMDKMLPVLGRVLAPETPNLWRNETLVEE
jgi:23S rRNA (adenine2030-N6)-methyltransferase